jgi:hypothetical protein
LHSSLRRLSYMRPNSIPGESIYHFRMRSQEILNNWAPSLRKSLVILQWVMEGTNSLIYIPLNDGELFSTILFYFWGALLKNLMRNHHFYIIFLALRESTEALNMVYGLHDSEDG